MAYNPITVTKNRLPEGSTPRDQNQLPDAQHRLSKAQNLFPESKNRLPGAQNRRSETQNPTPEVKNQLPKPKIDS